MKCDNQYIVRILSLIGLFLIFGNASSVGNTLDPNEKDHFVSAIQDGHDNPFIVDEISIGDASQIVSPTEYFGIGYGSFFSSCPNVSYAGISCLYNSSFYLQDKREFIFLYLFPFHFFW